MLRAVHPCWSEIRGEGGLVRNLPVVGRGGAEIASTEVKEGVSVCTSVETRTRGVAGSIEAMCTSVKVREGGEARYEEGNGSGWVCTSAETNKIGGAGSVGGGAGSVCVSVETRSDEGVVSFGGVAGSARSDGSFGGVAGSARSDGSF